MKNFKVFFEDKYLGNTLISPETTISHLKEYGKTITKHYSSHDSVKFYITDIYPQDNTKLYLERISDDTVLKPFWNDFTDPSLVIRFNKDIELGYNKLPPDIRRYLTNLVEPIQALELCKTVTCDWERLLNINYDFVTQGFAPKHFNPEEKFRYLASKVSRNVNTNEEPNVIFVHMNGVPMGKKTFLPELDNGEQWIYDKDDMKFLLEGLRKSVAIEYVNQDNYNTWIKVKPNSKHLLPTEFTEYNVGQDYNRIFRGNDMYDYPQDRVVLLKNITLRSIYYPGTINITYDVIKHTLFEIISMTENYPDIDYSVDNINEMNAELIFNYDIYLKIQTDEYLVYYMMREFSLTRSEAEVFIRANLERLNNPGLSFTDAITKLYGFDFNTLI